MTNLEEIAIPKDTVNDDFVIITRIIAENGKKVLTGEIIMEYETSKSNIEIISNTEGYVYFNCKEGDEIKVGSIIASIFDKVQKKVEASQVNDNSIISSKTLFSKSALNLITKNNIDMSFFENAKAVSEADVIKILGSGKSTSLNSNVDSVQLSVEKKREIEYLSSVQSSGLTSTVNVSLSIPNLDSIHNKNSIFVNSVLPVIIYEISRLLKKFKEFNSYFDNNFINFYKSVDIGIALDIEKGLKVVTIKGTNEYGYNEICEKLEGLVNLYLDDKLLSTDISSPTFTITDLSFENITSFIPLINRKNSAILGISSLDSFSNKMILSLTFDHRISSGKQSSRFLNDLKTNIQSHLINKTSKPLIFSANCLKCNISSLELEDSFGFIKVLTKEGKEGLCCRSCYNGW